MKSKDKDSVDPDCGSLAASIDGPLPNLKSVDSTIAIAKPSASALTYDVRSPHAEELKHLETEARKLFTAHNISASDIKRMKTRQVRAYTAPGVPHELLSGSFYIDIPDEDGERDGEHSVFLFMERGSAAYSVTHTSFNSGVAAGAAFQTLVDIFDANGDNRPEALLETIYYESNDYTVLGKTADGWEIVFKGGGGGC